MAKNRLIFVRKSPKTAF